MRIEDLARDAGVEVRWRSFLPGPVFVSEDGELFWGDDRLEQALDRIMLYPAGAAKIIMKAIEAAIAPIANRWGGDLLMLMATKHCIM